MAAYTHHMKTVVIPAENEPDLAEIDEIVRENVQFITANHLDTVLRAALVSPPETGVPADGGVQAPVLPPPRGDKPAVCVTQ